MDDAAKAPPSPWGETGEILSEKPVSAERTQASRKANSLGRLKCYPLLQAYINVPKEDEAARPTKGAADRAVLDRLAINISPKLFAYRIQLIKSWDQLKEVRHLFILSSSPCSLV